ncbi:PREDICTED: uncharacterized serine-rich protein C215.13-like [Amphimedon queenslandica]|uniref:Uncharacterized protein n=2 Tax=Amphimedon queenslandica TaxID=400682 RepID=A0AAN0JIE7_AMPQE|nr:PREDICTED: uncharacterized serine-rich protein C215.13-like [Amphimedon queenslandica]|eukprot:XP_019856576.1 PREDICTED: uncharacterized serine-rich protein C215.13-like [Amphimedon queenslandica]
MASSSVMSSSMTSSSVMPSSSVTSSSVISSSMTSSSVIKTSVLSSFSSPSPSSSLSPSPSPSSTPLSPSPSSSYKSPSPTPSLSSSHLPSVSPLPSSSPTSYKSSSLTPSPSSSIHSSSSRLLISTTSETRTSTSITSSIVPSPTCPSTIASVSLQNTITLLLTNYSIATFTSSAQERFKQITAEIVHNYCTYFKQDCNPIKLTDTTKTDGSVCVVITRILSGGSTNDQTLVTFFVTLNDGADLLPVTALTVSVEAGIRNGNYNSFTRVYLVSGSASSSMTPSATLSSSSSTGTTVGVAVGVVLLVMITIGVVVIVLVFMILKGRRASKYNIDGATFADATTNNRYGGNTVLKSVYEESEKATFSNPLYGQLDEDDGYEHMN